MQGIAAVTCGFGRIDIFYLEPFLPRAPQMAHQYLTEGQWRFGRDQLGGAFATVPAAVASHAVRPKPARQPDDLATPEVESIAVLPCKIDVFAVGQDYAMYQHTLWNGVSEQPPQWADLGGTFTSAPAAVVWEGARIDLFGLGLDRAMYRKVWNGTVWSNDWERLGGTFSSSASVVSMGSGRIDVFARGADYTLRHRAFSTTAPLNDWQNLGGSMASPPAAVSWGSNRLDVFAVGSEGALWHRWWDGEIWNDWESLGGSFTSAPSAVTWGPGRLDVFAVGVDSAVHHFWFEEETWFGPESLGGKMTSAPTAISVEINTFNVVAPSDEAKIRATAFDGSQWTPDFPGILDDTIALPTRYRFSVDYVTADEPRSLDSDTDTAQATIAPGNWPTQTAVQHLPDMGGGSPSQVQTNLLVFEPVTVELCENAGFNYLIVNNGHTDQLTLDTAVTKVGSAVGGKLIEVATGISLLGSATSEILSVLGSFLFQDCDGIVAAELLSFAGRELHMQTGAGSLDAVTTVHAGTDSPTGCGANSKYEVIWSVTRV